MERLKNWGLVDSFRHLNPDVTDRFSWFDYRSRGFEDEPKRGLRIDVIMASTGLVPRVKDAGWITSCVGWRSRRTMRRSGWN